MLRKPSRRPRRPRPPVVLAPRGRNPMTPRRHRRPSTERSGQSNRRKSPRRAPPPAETQQKQAVGPTRRTQPSFDRQTSKPPNARSKGPKGADRPAPPTPQATPTCGTPGNRPAQLCSQSAGFATTPSRESLAPGVRRRPRQMRERWKVEGASHTPPATESLGESHHAQKELYAGPPEGPLQLPQIRPPPRPTRRRGTRPARLARGRRWQTRGRAPQPSTARSGPQSRRRARRPRVRRPARHGPTAIPRCRQRARPGPRATAAILATRRARPTSLAAQARRGGQSRPQ